MSTRNQSTRNQSLNLGDLITLFYGEYLAMYRDEELASVAAAATINELLADMNVASA